MRTAIGTFGILGLRTSALATAIGLGLAAMGPAIASSNDPDQSVTSVTAIGVADMPDTSNVEVIPTALRFESAGILKSVDI